MSVNLVIDKGNQVAIIDVTCPFENGENALKTAQVKVSKYHHLQPCSLQQWEPWPI
jgi:hypothetical protein